MTRDEPRLMEGGLVADARGTIKFVNDFTFAGVKRFYIIETHEEGCVRAWHAHRYEAKYVAVVRGAAIVGAVRIEDWEKPPRDSTVHRYVLSASKPAILYIPGGFANGFKALTPEAGLVYFSTATLAESEVDDVRLEADYFDDAWAVGEGRG